MACSLRKDPGGAFDFLAAKDATVTIFVENDAGSATISSADLNGTDLPADDSGKIKTPKLQTGLATLSIVVDVALTGDEVRVKEDCGDGTSRLLKKFVFTGDPLKRYQIDVS